MSFRTVLVLASFALSILTGLVIARSHSNVRSNSAKQRYLIGFSMDTLKEERFQRDRDYFRDEAERLGAEVLVQAANSNDSQQIRDVEALISRNINVLVIMPHDTSAMAKAVELAHQSNIPVISYDRLITGCDVDLAVLFDNVKVGEMQGQYLLEHLKFPAKIIRLYGSKSDSNGMAFKRGQDKVLLPSIARGDIQVIHEDWVQDWKPENAKRIVDAAISQHGTSFAAILASNDGEAGGAIQALLEEGLAGKVLVTGQDAELTACQRIARGTQSMTVYKPIKEMATRAAQAAVALAEVKPVVARSETNNGKLEVPTIGVDVVMVTRENLRETVVREGFHTESQIFGAGAEN
jgi:D-xylose transport system substrate-binding protein